MGSYLEISRKETVTTLASLALPLLFATCGGAIDAGIPDCENDPQPKTKVVTLFPSSEYQLSVDRVFIKTGSSPGTIDTLDKGTAHSVYYSDRQINFRGLSNGRIYSIRVEPDTSPDNIGKDGTKVTIQADCETPQANP